MPKDRYSSDSAKQKRGRLEFRSGQPLAFVEDPNVAEDASELPLELRGAASQVIATLKAYRDAVKALLSGKYADLREFAPSHLRKPCDIVAICCKNGIIVRYELGVEGATKLRGGAVNVTLTELAPKLSDTLIHFPLDRQSYDLGLGGIPIEGVKKNFETGTEELIFSDRIVIFGSLQFDPSFSIPPPPSRPTCLLSCANEFHIEMLGEVVPSDQKSAGNIDKTREFIVAGLFKLPVGWQALEIYPAFQAEYWKPEFAALWAEMDILAAVARRRFADTQLAAMDPNVPARRAFKAALEEFARLLDGPEEPAHQFLKKHPEIISPTHTAAWSKLPLGDHVTDFVFREPSNDYLLVEIESPLRKLFRKDGQQREELTHAFNQIADWRVFIEDNLRKVQEEMELVNISSNPRSLIVIGRSEALTDNNRRKLATLQGQIPKLQIMTYDDLILRSKAMVENLFGPLDIITSENVEIFYPRTNSGAA